MANIWKKKCQKILHKIVYNKKMFANCKNSTYFREFSLEATVQISSQSVKIYSSYIAS